MLAMMRRVFIGSWLGRILAVLILLSFGAWGIGDFASSIFGGGANDAARVGGHEIGTAEFQRTYERGVASAAQRQGLADPTALPLPERRQIAVQALQQLVFQSVIADAARRAGIVVPDQVVRDQVFAEKAFLGPDGSFSRTVFDRRIAGAGLTEDQLLAIFRAQSAATALIEPIRIGAMAPPELVRRAFAFATEQRVLDMVTLPFAAIPAPAAPDEATLHRYYDNNADRFTAPEYRRIKLVLLSPATVGHDLPVTEADERRTYDELVARYQVPEKRSFQVLIVPGQAEAAQLAGLWRGGVAWSQLQATARDATPVSLDDAAAASIPSPDLARLVFAATPGTVGGPSKTEAGWVVVRVSKVTPADDRSFAQVQGELHDMIGSQRAAALLPARVQRLQDAIAGGGLDSIPSDLGATAAEGTLDAQGLTQAGDPAPLPGSDAVRKAILAQAFAIRKGDVPALLQGPENSWYALVVEQVTPAAPLAFVQAADRVRADWQRDAVRHADEQQAAVLYNDAQKAHGLAAAAVGRPGYQRDVVVRRDQTTGPVPANLVQLAFSLAPGTSTMVEAPDGFVVATITGVRHQGPAANPLEYARARQSLDAATADDVENAYVETLRNRANPKINAGIVDQVTGPGGAPGGSGS